MGTSWGSTDYNVVPYNPQVAHSTPGRAIPGLAQMCSHGVAECPRGARSIIAMDQLHGRPLIVESVWYSDVAPLGGPHGGFGVGAYTP